MASPLLTFFYLSLLGLGLLFAGWEFFLLFQHLKRSRSAAPSTPPSESTGPLPHVTVQIPLFNERFSAARVIEATEKALLTDGDLLNEPERAALDSALGALRDAAAGNEVRAIKLQLEAFNRASNEFASRRMDKSIRSALAGHKIDELRI